MVTNKISLKNLRSESESSMWKKTKIEKMLRFPQGIDIQWNKSGKIGTGSCRFI